MQTGQTGWMAASHGIAQSGKVEMVEAALGSGSASIVHRKAPRQPIIPSQASFGFFLDDPITWIS